MIRELDAAAAPPPANDRQRQGLDAADWSQLTLARGMTVSGALAARGIRATKSLLSVIAERNGITDFRRIAADTVLWLPTAQSLAERPELWRAASQHTREPAQRAADQDRTALPAESARTTLIAPAASPTTLAGLTPPEVAAKPSPDVQAPRAARVATASAEPEVARVAKREASATEALLALDPEQLTPEQVKLLPPEAAPRLLLLKGLFDIGDMGDLAKFFIAMGYPEHKLKNPDGSLALSSHRSSAELAGTVAWYYEQEGVPPIMIGHSQGGYMATKVLYELAGEGDGFAIWNPIEGRAEDRTTIRDPKTGETRSPVGLRLPLTATLATGRLMRALLPWQWSMMPRLYSIPDSAERFLTFNMRTDVIGSGWEPSEPAPGSRTQVRNIRLPDNHTHVGLPETSHLASAAATRQYIDAYVPPNKGAAGIIVPEAPPETNLIQAAELWRALTRAWCVEAQRQAGKPE